ncbi:patatin-like phospholipase family protein [Chryseosolibacter indicus]|uniref:Patatin-like phospholipase family protein n=1 Tax=Chryseosolibacter indicus TaxID=2782351 RepID=A0ABS5VNM3_9BACT|nr:patatin-like phospholipase family protein [Chryseosolibacter indicus]MBT1703044.1 patatin-like phospholipase family protein [Chryseosolibacter indicus]
MKHFLLVVILSLCGIKTYSQQKVGLVLSGGAAKGIAHVGVLKALEEHEVPIDYVVGTSMGGIIAGCYAAGMSPDQIENIVLSEQFLRWVNGLPETGYNYYYHEGEVNPNFLKVNLSLDSILNFQLNTSIASDVSLNFALTEQVAQASAISKKDFDNLFVPLRVVAADIFTQNQVILEKGLLSDALRATQTVPFFYNPIRVEGKYLFDGGVYNNFPVDVAQDVFKPDVIIGCNVSSKIYNDYPYDLDEKLIANSLLFLLLDKSDPASVPKNGVYIQPDLRGYTSFDFARAKSLVDSGYVQTLRQIEEIKSKITTTRSCEEVTSRRNEFNNKNAPLIFNEIKFKGFNSKQRKYLQHIFHYNPAKPEPLSFSKIKRSYFKLVSEQYFNNVYPNILFDSLNRSFQFQLTRRPQKNFQVEFGGVIASRDISNIFLGLNVYNFNNQLLHIYGGFQTGNFYKAAEIKTRLDFPFQMYVEPIIGYHTWDYLESDDLIQKVSSPTVLRRVNRLFGVHVGWPMGSFFKNSIGIVGINNRDDYSNRNVFVSSDTLDALKLTGFKTEFIFSANTLNRKQYASSGKNYCLTAQYFNINEELEPGNTSVEEGTVEANHQWFRVKASLEQYFNAGWFRPGVYLEGVLSNQPFFQNYKGTLINAPAFYPLQDSRTLLLENFRSFNFLAAGSRNVFRIKNRLDFRLEGYAFKPIEYLKETNNQETVAVKDLKSIYFSGTAGLVLHSPIGPISLSVNYYDDKENKLGVLLHAGFLLYNKHSLE